MRPALIAGLAAALLPSIAAGALLVAGHEHTAQVISRVVEPIIAPAMPDPTHLFGQSRIHVLVMGRDYDYTANDIEYSKESRSDIIMAFTVDFPTHTITELSVPRDTAVTMPDGSRQKINAALAEGGVANARAVVSNFLGVTFDRYALLRIDSTKDLIDAIGGIEVPVHETLDYDDSWGHLHLHVTPGVRHMDGTQAVAYARFRHDGCGDPCRIKRQQDVLHSIAAKLRGNQLNDVLHAQALISAIHHNVESDFSMPELLGLAWDFRGVDPHSVKTAQVPYTGDETLADGGDALVPDDAAKGQLVKQLMLGSFSPPAPPVGREGAASFDGAHAVLAVAEKRVIGFGSSGAL
jgi:LCP family protein required for cell wall assembly